MELAVHLALDLLLIVYCRNMIGHLPGLIVDSLDRNSKKNQYKKPPGSYKAFLTSSNHISLVMITFTLVIYYLLAEFVAVAACVYITEDDFNPLYTKIEVGLIVLFLLWAWRFILTNARQFYERKNAQSQGDLPLAGIKE